MSIINFPMMYVPDPVKGRPVGNGQIFVGTPDLDPEVPANQKQLNIVQEDGTVVPVPQPFDLSFGGVPVYNGSAVRLDVDGNYSFKVLSKQGAQLYYVENVFEGQPITELDLINDLSQTHNFDDTAQYAAFTDAFPVGKRIYIKSRKSYFNIADGVGSATGYGTIANNITTQSAKIAIQGNHYDAVAFGAKQGIDAGPVFQAISDVIVPFSTVTAKGIDFTVNSEVIHTVDDVEFKFFKSKMLNTVTLPIRVENSQGINPAFFIKANNCTTTGGRWLDWVTQAIYFGGVFNAVDPYDNEYKGVTAHHMKCERLISPTTQSKFIQTRHIDDVDIHHIRCKEMGKAISGSNAQPVSVNYCTEATIALCVVDGCNEGSAYNMLYVKQGTLNANRAKDIQNTLDPAINVAAHVKFSEGVTVTANNFKTINGECMKVSDGTDDVTVTGNTFETNGTNAGIFTVLQLQGTRKFNVTGNVIRTDGPRAIFATVHVNSSPQEGLINGNWIYRNVAALQPTSKGSGIWITCSTSDRSAVSVSGNHLFECDIYVNQLIDSHINNNDITITSPLFYNGFDQLGGVITQIAAPITLESCNTTTCQGTSIINRVSNPAGFQVGVRLINSVFCNVINSNVVYDAGSTLSYGYADVGSNSSIFRDNYSVNDVGYVQDINNATPAKHFYKRTNVVSMDIGTVAAGATATDTAGVEMIQISNGNTFLSTVLGLPTQANGLLWSGTFTANNTITFTFYNPTANPIVVNNRAYYITTERAPA